MIHPLTRIEQANANRSFGFKAFRPTQKAACRKAIETHGGKVVKVAGKGYIVNKAGNQMVRIVQYGNDPRDIRVVVNTCRTRR
jgi:hypothetical protein